MLTGAGSTLVSAVTTAREKTPRSSSRFSITLSFRGSSGSPARTSICRRTSDSRVRCKPGDANRPDGGGLAFDHVEHRDELGAFRLQP